MAQRISAGGVLVGSATACLLGLTAGCAANLAGGSSATEREPAQAIAPLTLEREGEELRLAGAPADPLYEAGYPNPELADSMTVRVGPAGEMRVQCEASGAEFPCRANPFHTMLERLPDGRVRVEVRDLFGQLVAEGTSDAEAGRFFDENGDPSTAPERSGESDGEFEGYDDGREDDPSAPRPDGEGDRYPDEPTREIEGYSGEVGVVVETLEGSMNGAPFALDPGAAVSANQSVHGSEYLRLDVGRQAYFSARGLESLHEETSPTREGTRFHLHVSGNGRGYDADPGGRFSGVMTHIEREDAADGATRRVHVDAVWPDESWVRLIFRYDSTSNDAPASMSAVGTSAPPSWSSFSETCTRPAERQQYCDAVNQEFIALGIQYTFDCTALPEHPTGEPPRVSVRSDDTPLNGCATVLSNPMQEMGGWATTDDACIGALLTTWENHGRNELMVDGMCSGSPIVLDLEGDGIALSGPEDGVAFDLFGSGHAVQTSWTAGDDDAFLVLDADGDGLVAGAEELFGHATAGGEHADGFAPLAELDDNGDGVLDSRDGAWSRLALWTDVDRDGQSRQSEMRSLEQAGVVSLSVRPSRVEGRDALDAHGNRLPLVAAFTLADGRVGEMADAFLRYRPLASEPFPAGVAMEGLTGATGSPGADTAATALHCGPSEL